MSVSDPLLKELKGHIFDLRRHSLAVSIDDHNLLLAPFCKTLEGILRKGLKTQTNSALGCIRRDYWNCFLALYQIKERLSLPLKVTSPIQTVKEYKKIHTVQGRGRLLLRVYLKRNLLKLAIESLLNAKDITTIFYNPNASILGNEILSEIFLSLLHEVDQVRFSLLLKNASFLDETWELGVFKAYEFVPCTDLGIAVGFSNGRAVITRVEDGSIAAEDDHLQVGDVLDELYGESLYGRKRGTISALLSHFEGFPVYISIVRCHFQDGTLYPPIATLHKNLKLTIPPPSSTSQETFEEPSPAPLPSGILLPELMDITEIPVNSPEGCSGFLANYLGKSYVGKEGRVLQIEKGIENVVLNKNKPVKNVIFDVEDCFVKVFDTFTKEVILMKHYTEMASCGRRNDMPSIFAIIAGETTCTVANHFDCYVYQVKNAHICRAILCNIAQGFSRTSWSV